MGRLEELAPIGAPRHLGFDLVGHDIVAVAHGPSATEGAVNGDETEHDISLGGGEGVLDGELGLLGRDHGRVIDLATLVLGHGKLGGTPGCGYGVRKQGRGALLIDEGRKAVFDFLLGKQDGLLIVEDRFLKLGVLDPDLVLQATIIEDGERKFAPALMVRPSQVNISASEFSAWLLPVNPNSPAREKEGYMLARATPMSADLEAAA